MKREISAYSRIVIKIGSALLVDQEHGLRRSWLETLVSDISVLKQTGTDVLIVSSGAIALGRRELSQTKLGERIQGSTLKLKESQAAAAIGQISLSRAYSETLGEHGLTAGQVLLTLGDTETRRRYLNARATIETLLKWNAIPIINENDTVATSEIRYGDNDRLAARVASMAGADLLILLSDVDGLYSAPPAQNPDATFFEFVPEITAEIQAMAGDAGSGLSRGGMKTKIEAAKIATAAGTTMLIASGKSDHPIEAIQNGSRSTWFAPSSNPINERKKWIAGGLEVSGSITIDEGALVALKAGKSLLPAGVTKVAGEFSRGDTVNILGPNGDRVGRGLIEYDSEQSNKIAGLKSSQIEKFLGPNIRTEMIHRDDMAV
ncbi:MAG: glutamate 5-kinase [Mariniblastus sp.]